MTEAIKILIRSLALILIQVWILDHITLAGSWIVLFIYPLAIIKLPNRLSKVASLLIGLSIGFIVDIFTGTYGLNASCGLLLGYFRSSFFRIISGREEMDEDLVPGMYQPNFQWFASVVLLSVLLHCFWYFNFSHFNLNSFFSIQAKAILSSICSFILMILAEMLFANPKKR